MDKKEKQIMSGGEELIIPEVVEEGEQLPAVLQEKAITVEAIEDIKEARNTFKSLIEQGMISMADLAELAQASDHPRAYEVLANTLRSIAEINNDMIKLHKTQKELEEIAEGSGGVPAGTVTNNAIFVGSSQDLKKLLTGSD
jgi:hypothetical protein